MALGYRFSRRASQANGAPVLIPPVPDQPVWRRFFAPPDPIHMDAGAEGEVLVAQVRVVLLLALLPIPLINLWLDPNHTAGLVGLGGVLAALALALFAWRLLQQDLYRPWLGLATSLLDVTLVSAALMALLYAGEPVAAVNSRLIFDVYFLAIGATALRYDARITLAAGLAAMVQYLVLLFLASSLYDLAAAGADPLNAYGRFDWGTQMSRLVLLLVATLLAMAIVLRSQRLRRQSRLDRLTGLPNRSLFDERVQAELSRARRNREPVALAMIDIDHFKPFNDTWGHAAGDVALRAVARAIQSGVRQSDIVVRYGGEEFVALFPGMGAEAAVERAEVLRRAVEALPLAVPRRHQTARVTISAGVSVYGYDGTEAEDLLDRADARLFQSKAAGRNRVTGPPPEADAATYAILRSFESTSHSQRADNK